MSVSKTFPGGLLPEVTVQEVRNHGVFECRLEHLPVRIGFSVGKDNSKLSHDPADALEVHDDLEMICKSHLDLPGTLLPLLEVVSLLNDYS